MFQVWLEKTGEALLDLWQGFLVFIPGLVGAVIIFVVGWFIALAIGKLIEEILIRLNLNKIFEKGGWKEALEKADIKVDSARFIGAVIKWVLVIVFLVAAVEVLGLEQFAEFLRDVLAYLPNVIVAVLIFVVTLIVVDIVDKLVRASVERVKVGYGNVVSLIVRWSIWVFAVLAILRQLLIVPELIDIIFRAVVYGVVALIVISSSIAFGLGGKEMAAEILGDLKKKIKGGK